MLTTTEGIVLKTQKYSEADLIITYLTLNQGIIKAFAKSPRKTKSRFGSSFEPLTHARITMWGKEQSMPKLTHSDILKSFQGLRENFDDFINISKLIEILISLTPEHTPNKKIFSFFLNMIDFLESMGPKKKDVLYLMSQIRLLSMMGYAPRVNGCGKCGVKSLDFYPDAGTTLCKKCAAAPYEKNAHYIKITDRLVSFYSHIIRWPIHASPRLRPDQGLTVKLSVLLDEHLKHLLNKQLQSSEFIAGVQLDSQRI